MRTSIVSDNTGETVYTYDADGLRTSKAGPAGTEYYVDDNGQLVVKVYNGNPNASCVSYIRGLNLIASVKDGVSTYYHYDAHGNVVQLTDSTGELVRDYTYDAFGVERNASDTDTNPFRYCGEQYDAETGNYYLRARYYAPGTGSFTQEDPAMDGSNWYTYCTGNPLMFMDPSGLASANGYVPVADLNRFSTNSNGYAPVADLKNRLRISYFPPGSTMKVATDTVLTPRKVHLHIFTSKHRMGKNGNSEAMVRHMNLIMTAQSLEIPLTGLESNLKKTKMTRITTERVEEEQVDLVGIGTAIKSNITRRKKKARRKHQLTAQHFSLVLEALGWDILYIGERA